MLSPDQAFSARRIVRNDVADSPVCSFDPANIAEGYGRETTGSYVQSLRIAQGSLKELETHLLLSERVGLAQHDDIKGLTSSCEQIGKMLRSLIRAIQNSNNAE